jgi:hypothetical protein
VTPVLLAVAAITVAGAVVAVSAREPRFAVLGMLVALLGAPYVADPLPGPVALGARLIGTVLAGYLVWVSLRSAAVPTAGSRLGWAGAAMIAVAASAAGWLSATSLGAALAATGGDEAVSGAGGATLASGSPEATAAMAAAFALAALAAGPALLGRDVLRLGLGLLLAVGAADLFRAALSGRSDDVAELGMAVLIALAGAGVAAVARRSLRLHHDLELRAPSAREAAVRSRTTDDAHPIERRG